MANPFETSFIPQQPLLKVEGATPKRGEPVNLALILALIIFFVVIAVGVGIYFYKAQIDDQVKAKNEQLQAAEKTFNIDEVNSYKKLQVTLNTAKKLVDEHAIFNAVFGFIEQNAAQNIGLTALGYSRENGDIAVALSAQAPSYAAAYFQGEAWKKAGPMVKSVQINGIALDVTTGVIGFSAKIILDQQFMQNARVIQAATERSQNDAATAAAQAVMAPPATPPSVATATVPVAPAPAPAPIKTPTPAPKVTPKSTTP